MTEKTVDTPNAVQAATAARAALPRALVGGTATMRAAGETYLPKEEGESDAAYKTRKNRTFLFNAFGKTVGDMTGKVFTKPIALGDDVPTPLVEYAENIDMAGRHLNVFARDVFFDALQPGIGYILVDMPRRPKGLPNTRAADAEAGIRPYAVYISAERLIGWKSETRKGAEVLTQVRIRETATEPDGDFDEKEIEQIRVLEPGKWQTWRKSANGKWGIHEEGTMSLSEIPLVPVYLNRTGFMTGAPPLEKLAELNVEHWQTRSDLRNIVHVACVPILFAAGFDEQTQIVVGVGSAMRSSDVNAKLEFVEHSGKAIGAARDDLKDLEFRMQAMGLQLLVPDPGQSATGEIRDDAKENSPLAMMALALGDALENMLVLMAKFSSNGDNGGSVTVNTDYGVMAGAQDIAQILNAYNAGLISRETAWTELERRGFLSDSFDAEVEAGRIDVEPPALDAPAIDLNAGA